MAAAQRGDEFGDIAFQVSTLRDEHGQDNKRFRSFGHQLVYAVAECRGHEFEKSQFDPHQRLLLLNRLLYTAQRTRPFGVSGTVREKYERLFHRRSLTQEPDLAPAGCLRSENALNLNGQKRRRGEPES